MTKDPHIPARVNIASPDDKYPKLNIYISELILGSYEYIPVASIRNNALRDLTLLIVDRFVGIGGFLIRMFCRLYEIYISPVKKFRLLFKN
jgi:hypothetical protein